MRPISALPVTLSLELPVKFSTQVRRLSYLKNHAAEIVKDIQESREPMLITQNGEAKLVVMDVRSHEEQEEALPRCQDRCPLIPI